MDLVTHDFIRVLIWVSAALAATGMALILVYVSLRIRIGEGFASIVPPILLSSPSIADLRVLAQSATEDRVDVIKEYYDWQQKVLLAVIAGVATFIGGNAVLLIQTAAGKADAADQVSVLLGRPVIATAFATTLILLLLWAICLFARLVRLPREYMTSVTLYQVLR